jgi:hypothetical protein
MRIAPDNITLTESLVVEKLRDYSGIGGDELF